MATLEAIPILVAMGLLGLQYMLNGKRGALGADVDLRDITRNQLRFAKRSGLGTGFQQRIQSMIESSTDTGTMTVAEAEEYMDVCKQLCDILRTIFGDKKLSAADVDKYTGVLDSLNARGFIHEYDDFDTAFEEHKRELQNHLASVSNSVPAVLTASTRVLRGCFASFEDIIGMSESFLQTYAKYKSPSSDITPQRAGDIVEELTGTCEKVLEELIAI